MYKRQLPLLGFRRRRTKHVCPASAAIQKVCRIRASKRWSALLTQTKSRIGFTCGMTYCIEPRGGTVAMSGVHEWCVRDFWIGRAARIFHRVPPLRSLASRETGLNVSSLAVLTANLAADDVAG